MNDNYTKNGIAIIGMSCRFPGANNIEQFWEVLSKGQSLFTGIPEERKQQFDFSTLYSQKGAFLENPFHFDNNQFRISENEALAMDPQQRIMLELALEAKESAAIDVFKNQDIGVYIGANQRAYVEGINAAYYKKHLVEKIKELESLTRIPPEIRKEFLQELDCLGQINVLDPSTITGNITNMISSRISREFNLFGPSLTIDTACSSSLVSVHLACESLYKKECSLAFAGGVNLNLTPSIFRLMEAVQAVSKSGNCIPFSEESDGILLGEGAGLVLLKRLDEAIEDGDHILAVIKGSGINSDGRSIGVMAPNWKGQLRLLETVYKDCNYDSNNISLIEAHGTSTRIGDSVEITVLKQFFAKHPKTISIGSVKSNIGHLLGASGIAGLIKTILAIDRKKLPISLFGNKVNPKWNLEDEGFKVQDKLEDWDAEHIRAAGVSSFGFGGTNAHLILEEPDPTIPNISKTPIYTQLVRQKFKYDQFPGLKRVD